MTQTLGVNGALYIPILVGSTVTGSKPGLHRHKWDVVAKSGKHRALAPQLLFSHKSTGVSHLSPVNLMMREQNINNYPLDISLHVCVHRIPRSPPLYGQITRVVLVLGS